LKFSKNINDWSPNFKPTILGIILILIFSCSRDDGNGPPLNSEKVRLTSYTYQTDFMEEAEEFDFEYNQNGNIDKIVQGTSVMNLSYNNNGQIINDSRRTYTYKENGKISEIIDNYGGVISIEYDDTNLMRKIESSNPYESVFLIVEYSYDSEGRIIESFSYLKENDELIWHTFKFFFSYDESNQMISHIYEEYDENNELLGKGETFYYYLETTNPNELIHNHLGLNNKYSLFDFIDFTDQVIFLDISGLCRYFPYRNIKRIEGSYDYLYINEYTLDEKTGYPSYNKGTYTDGFGRRNVRENFWFYETY